MLDSDEQKITGLYKKVVLTTNSNLFPGTLADPAEKIKKTFLCDDLSFDDVSIPMTDYEACKLNTAKTGFNASTNVNRFSPKCKFEPYRPEFFAKDATTGIYTKR